MTLSTFQDLLDAATRQDEPQRLLFVFARIGLPENATPEQHERFARKEGGTISPCLCVDKAVGEVAGFEALVDLVFVGALAGRAGIAPGSDEAAQPLRFMVNAINTGRVGDFAVFDRQGEVVQFG